MKASEILSAYKQVLDPLCQLGSMGLANFYAHLVFPWTWKHEVQRRIYAKSRRWRWLGRVEARLKERAERGVMGGRYDALYVNRAEPSQSPWKLSFDRDCQAVRLD